MKNKKILMILIGFLASIILVSCGLGINDTVQDVTSEIHQETPKEDTEGLGIKQVLEQKNGENVDISTKDFTGYIYIMSTKENIESIRKSEFNKLSVNKSGDSLKIKSQNSSEKITSLFG